jgi:S-formylglutathione hydrolase FrmB
MGGYGALRIALTESGRFAAVATHSAMLLASIPTKSDGAGRWHMAAFHAAFGNPIDAARWKAADPLALAAQADGRSTPSLYFDCGAEDRYGLAVGNQRLHDTLAARGVPHTFALPPGDHGYDFVRGRLEESLRFVDRAFAEPKRPGGEP